MDDREYRRSSYETWEALAAGWERWQELNARATAPVREWLVRELAPGPGDRLLELAAGPGETGFAAATLVGERGHLLCTDFSPDMVEVARRRGAELGLRNVDYRVMDAERIDLEADSLDGVICRFGLMLMPDPAAALDESRRVLREGGRLVLSVWGPLARNPWAAVGVGLLIEHGHVQPPEPGAPGPFSMGDPERVRALLEKAGFARVRTEEVPVHFALRDVDEYVQWCADTAGPFAQAIRGLSQDETQALKAGLEERFAPFATANGYELPGLALNAVAS